MKDLLSNKYFKLIIIEASIIILLVIIFIFVNSSFINFMPPCYWQENFGIICPSCGSTRCVVSLMHGDFSAAFLYNPFTFIFITYLFLLNLLHIINTITNKKFLRCFYPKWWYVIIYFSLWAIYTVTINILNFI